MRHLAQNRVAVSRILALGVLLVAALVVVSPWLASKPALAAATFTVTNTSDSGAGSLRQAMLDANSIPGVDSIDFDIPGSGVQVISPDSELPNITEGVSINGYTQSGASPNTRAIGNNAMLKVELDGTRVPGGYGLRTGAANSTVKGLVISTWDSGVRMGGNDAAGNKIVGNFIGIDASGTQDAGNCTGVPLVDAPNNAVGGTAAGERNVIAFNGNGVYIQGVEATSNNVVNNYIGTDASGTKDPGTGGDGVRISASNNTIGGTSAGTRNVISGNDEGVVIVGNGATGNKVTGNNIGTDASGTKDVGNDTSGVTIVDAPNNAVGGTTGGSRNSIAFNGDAGVAILGRTPRATACSPTPSSPPSGWV